MFDRWSPRLCLPIQPKERFLAALRMTDYPRSFRAQGFDGVELGGLGCRISSKKQADTQRDREAADDRPELHSARQRRDPGNEFGHEHADQDADRAANDRDRSEEHTSELQSLAY